MKFNSILQKMWAACVLLALICVYPCLADVVTWHNGNRNPVIDNSFRLSISLDQGRIWELLNSGANAFASGTGGGLTFHVVGSDGKWYYSTNEPANTTYFKVHEAGKSYFRVEMSPFVLKASDGTVSPIRVTLNIYVWPDRAYGEAIFTNTGTSSVSVRKMDVMTTFDSVRFNRFTPRGSSAQPIPSGSMSLNYPSNNMPVSGFTLFNSSSSNGSVSYILGKPYNTRHLDVYYGTYADRTSNAIICLQTIWDYSKDGSELSMPASSTQSAFFQLYASGDNTSSTGEAQIERESSVPSISVLNSYPGASYNGYDAVRGCHVVTIPAATGPNTGGYRFSNELQNYYEFAKIQIRAHSLAHQNRFKIYKGGSGLWGSGVTADEWGVPRGEPVTTCRTVGLNSYFVIDSEANQSLTFHHTGVFKRWGENPCFMTSSEDPYGGWWSNDVNGITGGVSYNWDTQHIYCGASTICDMDVINGNPKEMDPTSQFAESSGGWEFLKYKPQGASTWTELVMRGLTYDRVSPNIVQRTYYAESPDAKIAATIEIINAPFSHVARQFFHIRYDVKQGISFGSSDSGLQGRLRLFSVSDEDWLQNNNYVNFAYPDWNGLHVYPWSQVTNLIMGNPYVDPIPWVCQYGGSIHGNRGLVIRDFACKVDGQTDYNPAFTTCQLGSYNYGLSLVTRVATSNYRLIPGDYFDIWLEGIAWGTENSNYSEVEKEANAWGGYTSGQYTYHTSVSEGTLVRDFPTRVKIDPSTGQTTFTVRGGNNYLPLEIDGFGSYTTASHKVPVLEERINNCWVPCDSSVSGNDGYDIIKDPTTGTYGAIFSVWFDGSVSTRTFRASMGKNRLEFESYSDSSAAPAIQNNTQEGGQFVQVGSQGWVQNSYTQADSVSKYFTPTIRYRSGSEFTAHFSIDGNPCASFIAPATGTNWGSIDTPDFLLSSGTRTIRLTIDSGNADLNYVQLNFERPVPTAPYDAVCIRHNLPVVLNLGQTSIPGWITFKNIGTNSWTGSSQFGLCSPMLLGRADYSSYLRAAEVITPGQSRTFMVQFDTPIVADPSQYHFYTTQWSMFYPGHTFGQTWNREIQCTSMAATNSQKPSAPIVTDAGIYTGNNHSLAASWVSANPYGIIVRCKYAIGTTSTYNDSTVVVGWTDSASTTSTTAAGLSLADGVTYYFYIMCQNALGMWSDIGVSNGIMVDSTPPSIDSVTITPTMAAADDLLHVVVNATDLSGVNSINVDDAVLEKTGTTTWTGDIIASPTLGTNTVTVSAIDALGNTSSSTSSYKTAAVVGITGRSIKDYLADASSIWLYKMWGRVTLIDKDSFTIDDGTGTPIRVFAPGYSGIATGYYVSVRGVLDVSSTPKTLTARAEHVIRHN